MRYTDLLEAVRRDLNGLLSLMDEETAASTDQLARRSGDAKDQQEKKLRREKAEVRLLTIGRVAAKLFTDNAEGRVDDERLRRMVADLVRASAA